MLIKRLNHMDQLLQSRVATHTIFWAVLFFTTTFIASFNHGLFRNNLITNTSLLPVQIAASYLLCYYQIPKLLLKKKYFLFVITCMLSISVFSVLARLSVIYIAEPFIRADFEQETLWEVINDFSYLLAVFAPSVYLFPIIMLVVKELKDRFEEKHQYNLIQKEKATSELNFLKAQIHPHFLFNTLNNLYTLTLNKSDAAPEVVVKLSEILDYMLYQCQDPKVEIAKEKELIQNYIDLELLRYGDRLDLVFDAQIDNPKTTIAPLILVSLVENAFKHGASKNTVNPTVHISLSVQKKELKFKVFNTKLPPLETTESSIKKGIGSTNIQRQLDLIYPNNYELHIEDTLYSYTLTLEISL